MVKLRIAQASELFPAQGTVARPFRLQKLATWDCLVVYFTVGGGVGWELLCVHEWLISGAGTGNSWRAG